MKKIMSLILVFTLLFISLFSINDISYAKGDLNEAIKVNILKKYKAVSNKKIDCKKHVTTNMYNMLSTDNIDISNFKISSVTYFNENGIVTKQFKGEEAINHLVKRELMSSDDYYQDFPYCSALVETEESNVKTVHKKDYKESVKVEDILDNIITLGINISSAYWDKGITFAYAALTAAGEANSKYNMEEVLIATGPTFVITENSYIKTRTYEVLNVYNEGSDYEPAYITKDIKTSLGCGFYFKSATEDISAYEYLEDYIRETGTSFNDKMASHKSAIEYYKNSEGILPRYDYLEGSIDETTLNNILDKIKEDGYEKYLD